MRIFTKVSVASAAITLTLMGGASVALSPLAAASPNASVDASGGDGTAIDQDGTQGSFGDAVQGTLDDDGDQDARLTHSEEAAPQYSAAQK